MDFRSVREALPRSVGEAATVIAIFALGLLVGARAQPHASELWSFSGGVIGAAVTVAGSVYVLEWQKGREDRERKALLLSLLEEIDAACRYFHLAGERALLDRYNKTARDVVTELDGAIARVRRFGEVLTPDTVRMMRVADEVAALRMDESLWVQAEHAERYRDSGGDFGGLNAAGHEITSQTARIRSLLGD